MRYVLLIHEDETRYERMTEAENTAFLAEYDALIERMSKEGAFVAAMRLHFTTAATSVRVQNGRPLLTDGPFAETKEQFGGFVLVDVENLDAALAWAAQIPSARYGTIEVRPVWLALPE